MFSFITNIDLFDEAVPTHNLNGKRTVGSTIGGLTTLSMFYIIFLFGMTKLLHLVSRQNPTVNNYSRKDAFESDQKLSLNDSQFMIAFTMESYFTGKTLDDPRFMKWVAFLRLVIDGVS